MNPTEKIAALEARVAELSDTAKLIGAVAALEDTVKLIQDAPQLRAFMVEQRRIARIRGDADLVASLVSGSPEERAEKIAGLNAYRLRQVVETIQFSDLVDICRGLELGALSALVGVTSLEVHRNAIAQAMPARDLPDLVRIDTLVPESSASIPGLGATLLTRERWEAMVASEEGIRGALKYNQIKAVQLGEAEVRDQLAKSGHLDEKTLTFSIDLLDPRDEATAAVAAREELSVSASAARRKRAEKAPKAEPPAVELGRYQKNLAAQQREQRVGELAEGIARALDKATAKKKSAPK